MRDRLEKKRKLKGRLKRSCETAKGKLRHNQKRREKKRKKIMELTRDLISFNLYLIFYLPRYNVLTTFRIVFSFPLFSLFRLFFFFFFVLSPGLLCRRHESLFRFPFHAGLFRFNLSRSLVSFPFILFFNFSLSHSPIHVSHSHICCSLASNISYLKIKTTSSMSFTLFLSLSLVLARLQRDKWQM